MSESNQQLLSIAEINDYVEFVEKMGNERRQAWGARFHDDDYLCGAMAFFFHFGIPGKIPGSWVFGIMADRSPLEDHKLRALARQIELLTDYAETDVDDEWLQARIRSLQEALDKTSYGREERP